jgi:hypothetical protein
MVVNITGEVVATGVNDPLNMFIVVGVILGIGFLIFGGYTLYKIIGG